MKTIKIFSTLICLLIFSELSITHAQASLEVGVSVRSAPPPLPAYKQPPCPIEGYLWTPGYWAYGDDGYYWVPGVWVSPPRHGYLWTPCYWGFDNGVYVFHHGYWGMHVGFYGGINYGFGYGGTGYCGGRWEGRVFRYNTAVVNVNTTVVRNTYVDKTVVVNNSRGTRNSFNGTGGVERRPNEQEQSAMREERTPATSEQTSHQQTASKDRGQLASENKGRPTTSAMNKVDGERYNPKGRPPKQHAQKKNGKTKKAKEPKQKRVRKGRKNG